MPSFLSYPEKTIRVPSEAFDTRFGWLGQVAVGVMFVRESLQSVTVKICNLIPFGLTDDLDKQALDFVVRLDNLFPVVAVGIQQNHVKVVFKDGEICDISVPERKFERLFHLRGHGLLKTAYWSSDGKFLVGVSEQNDYLVATVDTLVSSCCIEDVFEAKLGGVELPKCPLPLSGVQEPLLTFSAFPSLTCIDETRVSANFPSPCCVQDGNWYTAVVTRRASSYHGALNNTILPVKADRSAAYVVSRQTEDSVCSVDTTGTYREMLYLKNKNNNKFRKYHALAWDEDSQTMLLQIDGYFQVWRRHAGCLILLRQFALGNAAYTIENGQCGIILKRNTGSELLVLFSVPGAIKLLHVSEDSALQYHTRRLGLVSVTSKAEMIAPLPFALEDVTSIWCSESPPIGLVMSQNGHYIAALHSNALEVIHRCPGQLTPACAMSIHLSGVDLRQAIFTEENELLILGDSFLEKALLVRITFRGNCIVAVQVCCLPSILRLIGSVESSLAALQDNLRFVSFNMRTCELNTFGQVKSLNADIRLLSRNAQGFDFCNLVDGKLMLGPECVSTGCSSFILYKNILFYTNRNGNLFAYDVVDKQLLYTRFIETGAKINQVKWKSACVVMQLPRGSLEMVYPQFLLKSSIQNDILHHRYDVAFRKGLLHRVDVTDLLIRSLSTYTESLACFLAKLSRKQHIESFVLGLKRRLPSDNAKLILERIYQLLEKEDLHNMDLIAVVLLTLSKDNLAKVIKATVAVWNASNQLLVSRVISKILEHCQLDEVFRLVLECGDLDFALFLTQRTECDKPSYLMFLRHISNMGDQERSFAVADYLGNYEKALKLLPFCDDESFRRLKNYIINHDLFSHGISEQRLSPEQRHEIFFAYGERLYGLENYYDAGIIFEYLGELHQALAAFCEGTYWQESIFVAHQMQMSDDDQHKLALNLVERLLASQNFKAASVVTLEHLQDKESAITMLCKGIYYAEAFRTAVLADRGRFVESIDRSLLADSKALILTLQQVVSEGNVYINTLSQFPSGVMKYEAAVAVDVDIPDNLSLNSAFTNSTTTSFSNSSIVSGHSQKRARKMRRKWKAGSLYEREHTLHAMKLIFQRKEEFESDFLKLAPSLMRRRFRDICFQLRAVFEEYMSMTQHFGKYLGLQDEREPPEFSFIL